MKKSTYIFKSFISAFGVFAYVFGVTMLLSNAESIFGNQQSEFFIPVFMLLLLIVSATITGLLVLGKPIQLYIAGLKKEALFMLSATVGWLVVFIAVVSVIMIIV
ncbi:MAG: hypothetical protein PHP35_00360 [Candidatus Colwellbacteria bacterium]|nr:hypothetical protein [Candidatus Colwellbacteria bacterium]